MVIIYVFTYLFILHCFKVFLGDKYHMTVRIKTPFLHRKHDAKGLKISSRKGSRKELSSVQKRILKIRMSQEHWPSQFRGISS